LSQRLAVYRNQWSIARLEKKASQPGELHLGFSNYAREVIDQENKILPTDQNISENGRGITGTGISKNRPSLILRLQIFGKSAGLVAAIGIFPDRSEYFGGN
jgi:hypothetical protein